jgi:hypothetical protein
MLKGLIARTLSQISTPGPGGPKVFSKEAGAAGLGPIFRTLGTNR